MFCLIFWVPFTVQNLRISQPFRFVRFMTLTQTAQWPNLGVAHGASALFTPRVVSQYFKIAQNALKESFSTKIGVFPTTVMTPGK